MKVKLIKVHPCWNTLYPNEFNVGDELELNGDSVTTKSGLTFRADDMCMSFGFSCTYSDIFQKV